MIDFEPDEDLFEQYPNTGLFGVIVVCSVGFLIADLITPYALDRIGPESAIIALGLFHIVVAQLTLICVWGTLVHGTFWIRLPWTLLLLAVSWMALAWGLPDSPNSNEVLGLGLMWLYGFLVSFVPLKLAAMCFRWLIVQEDPEERKAKQVSSIKDIFIGTALLAAVLAISQALLPDSDFTWKGVLNASGFDDSQWWFLMGVVGVVSLLIKMPCIWMALAVPSEKLGSWFWGWAAYVVFVTLVEYGVCYAVLGSPGSNSLELLIAALIGHYLLGLIVFGVLFALRGFGYRLLRSIPEKGMLPKVLD